jgi:hypothetical protein
MQTKKTYDILLRSHCCFLGETLLSQVESAAFSLHYKHAPYVFQRIILLACDASKKKTFLAASLTRLDKARVLS